MPYDRAIALDPGYAHAHAWKACVLGQTWTRNWCANRADTEREIMAFGKLYPMNARPIQPLNGRAIEATR